MIETRAYVRTPFEVQAVQITGKNMNEAAAWCQGQIQNRNGKRWIQVDVRNPQTDRQSRAYVGDWLLLASPTSGFKVYSDRAFKSSFDAVPGAPAVMQGPPVGAADDGRAAEAAAVVVEAASTLFGGANPPVPTPPKNRPVVPASFSDSEAGSIAAQQDEFAAEQEALAAVEATPSFEQKVLDRSEEKEVQ